MTIRGEKIRVCKNFFLGTLNISQKPIYTAHKEANLPKRDMRGKTSSRSISSDRKEDVKTHIKLFHVIDSHYCRKTTQRKYLEANLSVVKLYYLYIKWCEEQNKNPVKLSYYRYIFNTEFNYSFHIPKKDRCLKCEDYKIKKADNLLTDEEQIAFDQHTKTKNDMRLERNSDRENKVPVLSFDLENVITCPRSEVGDFFYMQKLNIYNLTGYYSLTKTVYCAIWTEEKQGRSGNVLASAFRKILDRVLEDNNISDLVTWSDSCVSQNRNSFISFCIMDALKEHPEVKSITMKYSVPGHGAIQEVDNVHSNIERFMDKTEFYSPLSFIRNLKSVNKRQPYVILQMKNDDFKDYESCSKQLAFKKIPFSKVASLKFSQNVAEIEYKNSHSEEIFTKVSLRPQISQGLRNSGGPKTRGGPKMRGGSTRGRGGTRIATNRNKPSTILNLKPKVVPIRNELSKEKVAAIKKMISSCMPDIDKQYFSCLLNSLKLS